MATEKLNINAWDSGWPEGFLTNVDEAVAVADGQTISTTIASDVVVLGLDATAVIDLDTVTDVGITVRCKADGVVVDTASLLVELLIGGVAQGAAQSTGSLSGTFSNVVLSLANWDSDWTQAQLNGMQVQVTTARTGTTDAPTWHIDAIDVDITYTVNSYIKTPPIGSLAIAGKIPVRDVSTNHVAKYPAAGDVTLSGQAPTLAFSTVVATGSLSLEGKPSYVSPLTVQLQPNGWDSGWPYGFVSNIDEPTSAPDGQTISTDVPLQNAFIDFDNVSGIIDPLADVLGVSLVVRARYDWDVGSPPGNPALATSLYIDGLFIANLSISVIPTFTNTVISGADWNQAWTIAQLDSLQVRFQSHSLVDTGKLHIVDAVDVIVTYAPQSPMLLRPPAGDLSIASAAAPTLGRDKYEQPLLGTVTLAGQAVTIVRADQVLPSADALMLAATVPKRVVDFVPLPAIDALILAGKVPTKIVNHTALPAVETLTLAGKAVTIDTTGDHVGLPTRTELFLSTEAPLRQDGINDLIGPLVGGAVFVGQTPTLDATTSVWSLPAQAVAALAGAIPAAVDSQVRTVSVSTLSLVPSTPSASIGVPITVSEVGLIFALNPPYLGPLKAELTLAAQLPLRVVTHLVVPAAGALLIAEQLPVRVYNDPVPLVGSLQLASTTPILSFQTIIPLGGLELVNVTVDYGIEFIATPTDILIE